MVGDSMNDLGGAGQGEPRFVQSKGGKPKVKDTKTKVEMIALGLLSLLFIYLIVTTFFKPTPRTPLSDQQAMAPVNLPIHEGRSRFIATNIAQEEPSAAERVDEGKLDNSEWGRSPFSLRPESPEEEDALLTLKGIIRDRDSAYAVINQRIVKEGDRIADNTVKEIKETSVILESDEGIQTILKV